LQYDQSHVLTQNKTQFNLIYNLHTVKISTITWYTKWHYLLYEKCAT